MSEYFKETFVGKITVKNAEYEECTLEKIILQDEELKECIFLNCTFNNCDFSNLTIINSKVTDCKFNKCKLVGIEWNKFEYRFGFGNQFLNCYMPFSVFVGMDLKKCNFEECNLKESYFEEIDAKGVSFAKSDLEKTQFLKCNLSECNFIDAKNYFFDVRTNNCKNARLSKEDAVYLLRTFGIKLI